MRGRGEPRSGHYYAAVIFAINTLKLLDEMGRIYILLDEMGLDKVGLDEMGINQAYDTVWWDGLWEKLRRYGVEKEFVRMCEALYEGVEGSVLMDNEQSRWFSIEEGLHQGCPLSR